jgi:chemotaxis protein methyltransferase CheR
VRFETGNLAGDDPGLWATASYDVIFCRNVLMYFAPEQMRLAVERIARSLAPGGFLFLGHAETLHGVSDAFEVHHSHNTFYYRLRGGGHAGRPRWAPEQWIVPEAAWTPAPASDGTWIETIRSASERVAALVPNETADEASKPAIAWDSAPVLDLLCKERFAEALDTLRSRPPKAGDDRDTLLLEAALLAHSGQLAAADRHRFGECRRALPAGALP